MEYESIMGKGKKTVECPKCHKPGNPYFAKIPFGKGGKVSFHRYVKHTERTGRSGEVLQTTCYLGPVTEEEYNNRPKRIIESTETKLKQRLEAALKRIDDMRRGRKREIILTEESFKKMSKILKEELL